MSISISVLQSNLDNLKVIGAFMALRFLCRNEKGEVKCALYDVYKSKELKPIEHGFIFNKSCFLLLSWIYRGGLYPSSALSSVVKSLATLTAPYQFFVIKKSHFSGIPLQVIIIIVYGQ